MQEKKKREQDLAKKRQQKIDEERRNRVLTSLKIKASVILFITFFANNPKRQVHSFFPVKLSHAKKHGKLWNKNVTTILPPTRNGGFPGPSFLAIYFLCRP